MSHFLQYWKFTHAESKIAQGRIFGHTAGEQLNRVNVGDVVWIITICRSQLFVIGRMQVGKCIGYKEPRTFGAGVWEARYHAISEKGTEENLREINIMDIAKQLRFDSATGRDRLKLVGNRVNGKQFQTMRKLTEDSVFLLESKWDKNQARDLQKIEYQISIGAGFGNPETNKKVEKAAVNFVTEEYAKEGWKVKSVESEKCGYDLLCNKNEIEKHIEVKGISGTKVSFIITANEVKQAKINSKFVICAVTSALSKKPKLSRFTGRNFIKEFRLDAIAFKAGLSKDI